MYFFKKNFQLRQQLLVLTSAFSLFIGLLIVAVSTYVYHSYLETNLIHSTDTNLLFLADYIDNELNNIDQLILYCQSDEDIINFVESDADDPLKKLAAYQSLSNYCMYNASSKYFSRVSITNTSGNYIQMVSTSISSTLNVATALPNQDFFEALTEYSYKDYTIGFMPDIARKRETIVPLLHPITYKFNDQQGGYIYIEVNASLFSDALDNTYQEHAGDMYLTLGDNSYLYKDGIFTKNENPVSYIDPGQFIEGRNSGMLNRIQRNDGSRHLVVSEELNHSDCYVSQMLTEDEINSGFSILYLLIVFLLIVLFFISILLHHFLSRIITHPVQKIQQRLLQISDGDFSRDLSIEWNHEFGDIGKGVNQLAENIDQLLKDTVRNEQQKRDLEFQVLQSQINPHFLYNTLNSIKWMAVAQGATGISEVTTSLSSLLKSIAKGTSLLIPIREELNLIQHYFTIQQYRYGGTINLEISVDEESLYDCSIIKFTLQPLVENAIFHGIEPTGVPGTIQIHIYSVAADMLRIDITDHGVGMTQQTIERIFSEESVNTSNFFKELGIINIHQRIQYQFGSEYGLRINSKLGEYTTMSILIPKYISEEKTIERTAYADNQNV